MAVARSYERFGEGNGLKAVRSGEVRRGQETVRRGSEGLKRDRQWFREVKGEVKGG